jgi:hypothetical protein
LAGWLWPAAPAPVYQYATCEGVLIWAYDGPDGFVHWGHPTETSYIDYPLPLVGKARLLSLTECRVMVRDAVGALYLDFDGKSWSLPYVAYTVYLPLAENTYNLIPFIPDSPAWAYWEFADGTAQKLILEDK